MRYALPRRDATLGAGLFGLALLEVWVTPAALTASGRVIESMLALFAAGALALQRRWPVGSVLVAAACVSIASVAQADGRAWHIVAGCSRRTPAPGSAALGAPSSVSAPGVSSGFW
jgi:hypothetical protein